MFHILLVKGKKGSALEQNIQINSNMRIIISSHITDSAKRRQG